MLIPFGGGTSISGSLEAPGDEARPGRLGRPVAPEPRARRGPGRAARPRAGGRARARTSSASSPSAAGRSGTSPTPSPTRRSAAGSRRAPPGCSPTATATSPSSRAPSGWSRPPGVLATRPVPATSTGPERARDGARQRGPPRRDHGGDRARPAAARRARHPRLPVPGLGARRSPRCATSPPARRGRRSRACPTRTRRASRSPRARTRRRWTGVKSLALRTYLARRRGFDVGEMCLSFIGYEGPERHVAAQRKLTGRIVAPPRRPVHRRVARRALRPEEVRHARTSATSCSTAGPSPTCRRPRRRGARCGRSTTR